MALLLARLGTAALAPMRIAVTPDGIYIPGQHHGIWIMVSSEASIIPAGWDLSGRIRDAWKQHSRQPLLQVKVELCVQTDLTGMADAKDSDYYSIL